MRSLCVLASTTVAALAMTGCGSAEQNQIVKSFSYDVTSGKALLLTEFSTETNLNMELTIPVKNFGKVTFIPASAEHGFQIRSELDLSVFLDDGMLAQKVTTLPSGAAFPTYITTDLAQWTLRRDEKWAGRLYLGTQPEKRYVGTGLELNFVSEGFPAGLTVSQRFQDSQKRDLGVVTIYGPQMENGQIKIPGGLFIASDLNTLFKLRGEALKTMKVAGSRRLTAQPVALSAYEKFDVAGPNASAYESPTALLRLFRKFKSAAAEADMLAE